MIIILSLFLEKNLCPIIFRLGLVRDAERQFKSALKQQEMVDNFLYLAKVYIKLDQPLTSVEVYKQGLEKFPGEPALLTGVARIHEVCQPFGGTHAQ